MDAATEEEEEAVLTFASRRLLLYPQRSSAIAQAFEEALGFYVSPPPLGRWYLEPKHDRLRVLLLLLLLLLLLFVALVMMMKQCLLRGWNRTPLAIPRAFQYGSPREMPGRVEPMLSSQWLLLLLLLMLLLRSFLSPQPFSSWLDCFPSLLFSSRGRFGLSCFVMGCNKLKMG
jgi:hypothetical protein